MHGSEKQVRNWYVATDLLYIPVITCVASFMLSVCCSNIHSSHARCPIDGMATIDYSYYALGVY